MHRSVVRTDRPVTRFVTARSRPTSARLGLRSYYMFTPASVSTTILRRADVGPIVGRRAGWPVPVPARSGAGAPRPTIAMHWAHSGRARADRRSSAAAAPWRG